MTLKEHRTAEVQKMHADVLGSMDAAGNITWTAADVAARIRGLAPLSRSPRWTGAVEGYARFVEENDDHLRWAYMQGSVFFGYDTLGL